MDKILLIMQGIEAAIAAAPKVIAVAEAGKNLITSLAGAGVITDAKQDALHQRVDLVMDAYNRGEVPASLVVEPDPVPDAPPSAPPA